MDTRKMDAPLSLAEMRELQCCGVELRQGGSGGERCCQYQARRQIGAVFLRCSAGVLLELLVERGLRIETGIESDGRHLVTATVGSAQQDFGLLHPIAIDEFKK